MILSMQILLTATVAIKKNRKTEFLFYFIFSFTFVFYKRGNLNKISVKLRGKIEVNGSKFSPWYHYFDLSTKENGMDR